MPIFEDVLPINAKSGISNNKLMIPARMTNKLVGLRYTLIFWLKKDACSSSDEAFDFRFSVFDKMYHLYKLSYIIDYGCMGKFIPLRKYYKIFLKKFYTDYKLLIYRTSITNWSSIPKKVILCFAFYNIILKKRL